MNFNEIRVGVVLDYENQPYQVIKTDFIKVSQGKPTLRAKMRNLVDGRVLEKAFKPSTVVKEADLNRAKANFMYRDGEQFCFMDNTSYEQFSIDLESVGDISRFVKEGEDVEIMSFNQKPVAVYLPPKVTLKVTQAPPGVKGDTAGNATKRVTLETGYQVDVPLFIKEGDALRINTETGDYVERAN